MPVSRKRVKPATRTKRCRNCIHSRRNVEADGGDHLDGWTSTVTLKLGCVLNGEPEDTNCNYNNLPCFKLKHR